MHGDNSSVVNQINGLWRSSVCRADLRNAQHNLWKLAVHLNVKPYDLTFFHHVPRSQNTRPDSFANRAIDEGSFCTWQPEGLKRVFLELTRGLDCISFIQARFDGALRQSTGQSAVGISIELATPPLESVPLLEMGRRLDCKDSYEIELLGGHLVTRECLELYSKTIFN